MTFRQFFKSFKKGFKNFGQGISRIVNSALLLVVYILGVGVTSFFAKLFGKRFLDNKISKAKQSYWEDLDLKKEDTGNYYRQF